MATAAPLVVPPTHGALSLAGFVEHMPRKVANHPTAAELDAEGHRLGSLRFTPLGEQVAIHFPTGSLVGTIDANGVVTDGSAFRKGLPGGTDAILLHATRTAKGPVVYYGDVVHDPTKPQPIAPFRREKSGWFPLGASFGKDTAHLVQLLAWNDGAVGLFDSQAAMAEIAQGVDFNAPQRTWFGVVPKTTSSHEPPPWDAARARAAADASGETLFAVGSIDRSPSLILRTMSGGTTGAVTVDEVALPISARCADVTAEGSFLVPGALGEAWIVSSAARNGSGECESAPRIVAVLATKAGARAAKIAFEEADERAERAVVDEKGNLLLSTHSKRVVRIDRTLDATELVAPRAHRDGTLAYAWLDVGRAIWLVDNGKMVRRTADGKVTAFAIPDVVSKGPVISADPAASPRDCRFGDATFVAEEGFFAATCFTPGSCENGCEVVFRSGTSTAPPVEMY